MTTQAVVDHIHAIWEEVQGLKDAALDMQPGNNREVFINLTDYIARDTQFMAHKMGIELK